MAKGRFAFIPKDTTHCELLNSLPATARWLYVVLIAERGGLEHSFTFPYTEIAKVTGFSSATIRQGIKALEKAGFLGYERGGLERNTNKYCLADRWLHI